MKIFKIILMLLFIFQNSFGQRIIKTPTSPESVIIHGANFNRNAQSPTAYDALTPYVMNVHFILITANGGINPLTGSNVIDTPAQREFKFLECIKFLNKNYSASNIFFKYDGFQTIENQLIDANGNGDGWVLSSPPDPTGNYFPEDITQYTKVNALNLVFVSLDLNRNDWYSYLGLNASIFSTRILNSPLLEKSVVHKMGHILSMYHIYQNGSHFPPGHPLYDFTACEHIARSGPTFNADIAGDEVEDTPAQPILTDSNFQNNCGSFIPTSVGTNCEQLPYADVVNGNFMGNPDYVSACQLGFTAGQTKRMREFILNSPTIQYSPDLLGYVGVIENTRNTVASLFVPLSIGTSVSSTILSSTDNGDGTAKVCRSYVSSNFVFQPGFTYNFLEEPDLNSPVLSTRTVNDNPVIVEQPAFNCPFTIEELSPSLNNIASNLGQVETVCRGEVCVNDPFVMGTTIRTEILGSMNITLDELNAVQVKDPELYEKLMRHYYYILEKYTASGAKTKEVFYKN